MASISGFGQTGPLAHKTAFDYIAQAYSGLMHITGPADGPPTPTGMALADCTAGFHAFAGLGYALFRRSRTGKGCHIDISMVESLFHMQEQAVMAPSMDPDQRVERQGSHYQPLSPAGAFRGPDGWIVILCTQGQIESLWAAMGRPEFADDPRFGPAMARLEHREALTAEIEEWMASVSPMTTPSSRPWKPTGSPVPGCSTRPTPQPSPSSGSGARSARSPTRWPAPSMCPASPSGSPTPHPSPISTSTASARTTGPCSQDLLGYDAAAIDGLEARRCPPVQGALGPGFPDDADETPGWYRRCARGRRRAPPDRSGGHVGRRRSRW